MKKYIEPFIKVCKSVFKEFLSLDLEAKLPYIMETDEIMEWDISAIIGLSGEACGAVVISMKDQLAIKLTGFLTGREHQVLYADVVDAVGEIVNIIAGNVKQELEETFRLVISLPTIIKGKGHSINWPEGHARVICIPFVIANEQISAEQTFTLSVALESTKNA